MLSCWLLNFSRLFGKLASSKISASSLGISSSTNFLISEEILLPGGYFSEAGTSSFTLMLDFLDGCYLEESYLNKLDMGVLGAAKLSFLTGGELIAEGKALLSTSFCFINSFILTSS